jgi:type I restriction enzyme S subunit
MLDPGPRGRSAVLRRDDLVVNSTGTGTLGRVGIIEAHHLASEKLVADGHVTVVRVDPGKVMARFLWYQLCTDAFCEFANASLAVGATNQTELGRSALGRSPIHLPSMEEQQRIVDLLDVETARIDDLIREQVHLLLLLEEHYHAALLALVTRGLDQGSEATPRLELGGVPVARDWAVCPLRSLPVEIQTGPFGSQLHQSDYIEDGFPVVNPANLVGGRIRALHGMTVTAAKRSELERHVLKSGDIVFGRRGEMGRAGLVSDEESGWLCGTGSLRIRFTDPVFDSRYLKRFLETSLVNQHLEAASVGATMDNLNSGIVGRVPLVVPPASEQRRIADAADRLEQQITALSNEVSGGVALLREHRQALIIAAVKGVLDAVRRVADA